MSRAKLLLRARLGPRRPCGWSTFRRAASTTIGHSHAEDGGSEGLRSLVARVIENSSDSDALLDLTAEYLPEDLPFDVQDSLLQPSIGDGLLASIDRLCQKPHDRVAPERALKWLAEVGWTWPNSSVPKLISSLSQVKGTAACSLSLCKELSTSSPESMTVTVYSKIIASLGADGLLHVAEDLHKEAKSRFGDLEWTLEGAMIEARVLNEDFDRGLHQLRSFLNAGRSIDGDNRVIVSLLRSQPSATSAVGLQAELDGAGVALDRKCRAAVITACGNDKHKDLVEQLAAQVEDDDLYGGSASIRAFSSCREWRSALAVFHRMKIKDERVWAEMILMHIEGRQDIGTGWRYIRQMEDAGFGVSDDVYEALLCALVSSENMIGFLKVLRKMERSGRPMLERTFCAVLNCFHRYPYALVELSMLRRSGLSLPAECVSILNSGRALMSRMYAEEPEPDPLVPRKQFSEPDTAPSRAVSDKFSESIF
ncbi:hypothetical protein NDN08_005911 [Rhodosorus marinus]|uniref:Pentacotripeptide-repeat region of PRORP domain-containing protein n=1 Tax=Rhodosorus marinus TaxID=101924 RepID=A0AAV8V407_9RHOD|nr:hypothetical protein NDN08_005911 [Rhodosorus marinus]